MSWIERSIERPHGGRSDRLGSRTILKNMSECSRAWYPNAIVQAVKRRIAEELKWISHIRNVTWSDAIMDDVCNILLVYNMSLSHNANIALVGSQTIRMVYDQRLDLWVTWVIAKCQVADKMAIYPLEFNWINFRLTSMLKPELQRSTWHDDCCLEQRSWKFELFAYGWCWNLNK